MEHLDQIGVFSRQDPWRKANPRANNKRLHGCNLIVATEPEEMPVDLKASPIEALQD